LFRSARGSGRKSFSREVASVLDLLDPFMEIGPDILPGLLALLVAPGVVFALVVNRRYRRILTECLRIPSQTGLSGGDAAQKLLAVVGLGNVRVLLAPKLPGCGQYHPLTREVSLLNSIYLSKSVAAVGIAAHEVGHAVQYARGYFPAWLRTALVPTIRVSFIVGLLIVGVAITYPSALIWAGAALVGGCLLFPLVTLPVELDASRRARQLALEGRVILPSEQADMDRVLHAAMLTYVGQALKATLAFGMLVGFLAIQRATLEFVAIDGGSPPQYFPLIVLVVFLCFAGRVRKRAAVPPTARELNETGILLVHQGHFADAIAAFTKSLQLNPNLAAAYVNRGMAYCHTEQYGEALADLDRGVRLAPKVPDTHGSRAGLWLVRRELTRAVADYTEALRLGGCRASLLRDRGVAFLFQGKLEDALADLNESIQLNPKDAVTYNNRGATFQKRGEYTRAVADLRESMRLNPEFPSAYKNLAWLQATCPEASFRNGAEAVMNAERAWKLSQGKMVEWQAILAAAHAEAGNFSEAIRWQEKCLAESPAPAKAELEARLQLYRAGQAFRDTPVRTTEACARTCEAEEEERLANSLAVGCNGQA
jgi:Zn-dependent membrane protease YugP/Tfp pilus assembly protein PilF